MKPSLTYNYRDVLLAPARAFSVKQIAAMTGALILSYAIYVAACYLSHAVAGDNLDAVWSVYKLFPGLVFFPGEFLAQIVIIVGLLCAVFVLMLGFFAVSAINIQHMRGNRFFTIGEAVRFTLSRVKQLVVAELSIILFLLLIVVLFAILGLAGRIPYVGEWLYALFFVFPVYIVALFTVFIFAVLVVSVVLTPAVAAADPKGEGFGAILETFSTIIRQPLRWLGYTAYSLVAGKVVSFVYAYFAYRAVQFMFWSAGFVDGGKMERLTRSALTHLPVRADIVHEATNIFPGLDFGFHLSVWMRAGTHHAASYLVAFMIFVIFATVVGYFLTVIAVGQTYGFAAIRKFKDGYDVAGEKGMDTQGETAASAQSHADPVEM